MLMQQKDFLNDHIYKLNYLDNNLKKKKINKSKLKNGADEIIKIIPQNSERLLIQNKNYVIFIKVIKSDENNLLVIDDIIRKNVKSGDSFHINKNVIYSIRNFSENSVLILHSNYVNEEE